MSDVETPKHGILLESGTNEVEIMDFVLGEQSFGINVAKVKTLQKFDPTLVVGLPNNTADNPLRGYYYFRGTTIPLIDLALAVRVKTKKQWTERLALITEFNGITNAFVIDDLNKIHRTSWNKISPATALVGSYTSVITGSIRVGEKEVLLLDLEDIIGRIFPKSALSSVSVQKQVSPVIARRKKIRVMIAEDSVTIRTLILKILGESGYENIMVHNDGLGAYEQLQKMKQSTGEKGLSDSVDVLISDIEMPQLDGLTLCKKVRTELNDKKLPVIMFSSLINEQMALKCRSVGATDFITKPQINELIQMVDRYCLSPATPVEPTSH